MNEPDAGADTRRPPRIDWSSPTAWRSKPEQSRPPGWVGPVGAVGGARALEPDPTLLEHEPSTQLEEPTATMPEDPAGELPSEDPEVAQVEDASQEDLLGGGPSALSDLFAPLPQAPASEGSPGLLADLFGGGAFTPDSQAVVTESDPSLPAPETAQVREVVKEQDSAAGREAKDAETKSDALDTTTSLPVAAPAATRLARSVYTPPPPPPRKTTPSMSLAALTQEAATTLGSRTPSTTLHPDRETQEHDAAPQRPSDQPPAESAAASFANDHGRETAEDRRALPSDAKTTLQQAQAAPSDEPPLESAEEVQDATSPTEAVTTTGADVAPTPPKVSLSDPPVPDDLRQEQGRGTVVADRLRLLQEASMSPEDLQRITQNHAAQRPRWTQPSDETWERAQRLLSFISADTETHQVNSFVLTRDPVLDAQQRADMEVILAPRLMKMQKGMLSPAAQSQIFDVVYDELLGIGILGQLWRDADVSEIMVDAWDKISVERNGVIEMTPLRFASHEVAVRSARELSRKVSDRALTHANPIVTAQLPGARVAFCLGQITASGLSITMRKFRTLLGPDQLLAGGSVNAEMLDFLQRCVRARATILIAGGTGTGKTTQINILSNFIPDTERIVSIEDAFELQLANRHVVSLQTKESASSDDTVSVTQEMLLVHALRMRPDRIIIGEIREARGASLVMQAATTGHDGTMATIHASDPHTAVNERLSDLLTESGKPEAAARRSIAAAINLVVQVDRRRGRRFISHIDALSPSCIHNGIVVPEPIFVGELNSEGVPVFRRVGDVRPETDLGTKLQDQEAQLYR